MASPRLLRSVMWLLVILATAWMILAVRAAQVGETGDMATAFIGAGLLLAVAGWLGLQGARDRQRVRDAEARHAARMLLVAELGRHDDETLERIARKGGPAADAARMILQGRHLGNPAGSPRHSPPGTP